MVNSCAAFGCKKRATPETLANGVHFNRFPNNEEMKNKWIQAVNRVNFEPSKYSRLCSDHFGIEDYYVQNDGAFRLHKDAVPSVFVPIPKHLQRKLPMDRNKIPAERATSDVAATLSQSELETSIEDIAAKVIADNESDDTTNTLPKIHSTYSISFSNVQRVKVLTYLDHNYNLPNDVNKIKQKYFSFKDRALEKIEAQKIEIRKLKDIVKKQNKRIDKFSDLLLELRKEKLINSKAISGKFIFFFVFSKMIMILKSVVYQCVYNTFSTSGLNKGILSKLKPKADKTSKIAEYDDEILEFAQTVQYHSSKAYEYLRTLFELPHKTTLNRRIKSFQNLPAEIESHEDVPNHQNVSLTIDEMSKMESIEFCSDLKGSFGTVDFGNQLKLLTEEDATTANEDLVVMFPCDAESTSHLENIHAEKIHTCDYCDKSFGLYKSMIFHKQTVHFNKSGKHLECDTCGKTFLKESNLKIHKKTHLLNKSDVQKNHSSRKPVTKCHGKGWCKKSKSKKSRLPRGSKDYVGTKAKNGVDWTCNGCQKVFDNKGIFCTLIKQILHEINFSES